MENEFVSHVFDGTNFSCWSFRIEADLKAQKLHHCIERTLEEESFFTVVAEEGVAERVRKEALQKSRKVEDEKCKLFLLKTIAEPQREVVRGMSSPMLMWEALKELSDRKAARARSNGTFPSKCRICEKPGHKKVDCPLKKAKHAAGSVQQPKKRKAHAAESSAGAKKDVLFVQAEETKCVEADGKFRWVLDNDVSEHMIGDRNLLVNVRRMETPKVVNVAEVVVPLESRYVGEVKMKAVVGRRTLNCTVHDVLYVPGLTSNLFSVEKVAERGMEVSFGRNHARISKDGDVKCTATWNGSLYVLDVELEICGSAVDAEQDKVPEEKVQQEDKVCTDDELAGNDSIPEEDEVDLEEKSDPDDKVFDQEVPEEEDQVPEENPVSVPVENAVPELEEAAGKTRGRMKKHPAGFPELELERKWPAKPDHELKLKWPARLVDEIPNTNEALQKRDDSPLWKRAIDDESLEKNRTWDLVEARRILCYKWVLRIKKEEDGTAARYKTRLVVRGSQRAGYDYKETYARNVVRELPAEAVEQLHQTEERKPPGFERGIKVRKMNKSLVGAKALQNRKKRYRRRMLFKKISKLEGAQTERDRRSAARSCGRRPGKRRRRSPLNIRFCLRTDRNRHQLSGGKSRGEQVHYEEDLQDRKRMNLGASATSTSVIAGQEELTKLPFPPDK